MHLYEQIEKHFKKEYPKEGCGVLAVVKGKKQWFPVKNIAENNDDFISFAELTSPAGRFQIYSLYEP